MDRIFFTAETRRARRDFHALLMSFLARPGIFRTQAITYNEAFYTPLDLPSRGEYTIPPLKGDV